MGIKGLKTKSPGSWFILVALTCAMVAGILIVNAVRLAVPTMPVIVAKYNLEPGHELTEQDMDIRMYPRATVPADRLNENNFDTVIGKHVKTYIAAADPIRTTHVSEITPTGGTVSAKLTFINQSGWRALALPVEASKGLDISPGDKVDVIGTVDVKNNLTTSKVLVWGAPVISIPPPVDQSMGGINDDGIVIALSPQDSERVALAMAKGKVLVALNPLGEATGQSSNGITIEQIFNTQGGNLDVTQQQ